MTRDRLLKIALTLIGMLFCALALPMVMMFRQDAGTAMMFSLYATLGVFLLLAVREPAKHRSLIAFTAWSSFAHAIIMGWQALANIVMRGELIGVAVLVVIGAVLIVLAPRRATA